MDQIIFMSQVASIILWN